MKIYVVKMLSGPRVFKNKQKALKLHHEFYSEYEEVETFEPEENFTFCDNMTIAEILNLD